MESSQEETKTSHISKKVRKDTEQEDDDSKKIEDIQTLFDKLSRIEKLMLKLDRK